MTSNSSPFRVEILNTNNIPISGGSIGTITALADTKSLDAIGTLEFSMPAADEKAQYIQTGVKFDVYDQTDGYLGRYLFKSKTITDNSGEGVLRVSCYDYLKELSQRSVHFNRTYDNVDVGNILIDLLGIVGWQVNITATGTNQITYQGESVLKAIDGLKDRRGDHYRLNFNKASKVPTIDFGPLGDLSTISFEQFSGQIQTEFLSNPNNSIITSAKLVEESDEIYNRIIPLGGGQGADQLTIEVATLGDYDVLIGSNADGSEFFYIENNDSITEYGLKERILSYSNIVPLSASEQDILDASNSLKLTAEAFIVNHLVPTKQYNIDVVGLRRELLPGDKINIRYVQKRDGVVYISIDDYFWVMDITNSRSSNGVRTQRITISNTGKRNTSDEDVIISVVNDVYNLKNY